MKDVLKPDHDDHFLLRWLRGTLTFSGNLSIGLDKKIFYNII